MRVLFLLVALIFICESCDRDKTVAQNSNHGPLSAGQRPTTKFDYKLLNTSIAASINTTQTGGIVQTDWVPGIGSIDMNGDQKQDIFFRSETGPFYKYALVRGRLQDGIQFDFCKTPLLPNTRIDDSLNWETSTNSTIMIPIRHGFPEAGALGYPVYADENTLAGRYPDDTEDYNFWNNSEREYIERNNWRAAAYLGIRMINKADTLYGWIKLQVTDFYKINLHSYGIQK